MSFGMGEKADGYGKGRTYRKKGKNRSERQKAKRDLRKGKDPKSTYGKYKGWQV